MARLETYSPFASFTGGNTGYTVEQRRALRRSAETKRQRKLADIALEREKLRSAERRTAAEQTGRVAYGRTIAQGGITSAKIGAESGERQKRISAAGGIAQQRIATAGNLEEQRLVGAQKREDPLFTARQRELGAADYNRAALSAAADYTQFTENKEGEPVPVMPTEVRQIIQKHSVAGDTKKMREEIGAWGEKIKSEKTQLDTLVSELGGDVPEEFFQDIDVLEGTGDESIEKVRSWTRELERIKAEKGERARREETATKLSDVVKGTWRGTPGKTDYSSILYGGL